VEICARNVDLTFGGNIHEPVLARYDAIKVIAENISDDIIVANLGIHQRNYLK